MIHQQAAFLGFLDCFWLLGCACLIGRLWFSSRGNSDRLALAPDISVEQWVLEGGCRNDLGWQFQIAAVDAPQIRFTDAPLEVHTWVQSEIGQISPLVDWLMSLIAASRCVSRRGRVRELALREALSNAIIHGNRLDARKLVRVCCPLRRRQRVFIVVRDQGNGIRPP